MKKQNKKSNTKTEQFKKDNQELKNTLQRLQADFENFRKRVDADKANLIKYTNEDLILEVLPVLDNFSRALEHKPAFLDRHSEFISKSQEIPNQVRDDINTNIKKIIDYIKGVELIKIQLEQILNNRGLTKISAKIGDNFDPSVHEAIESINNDKLASDQVAEIILDGYILGDKVIRPAKVKVVK